MDDENVLQIGMNYHSVVKKNKIVEFIWIEIETIFQRAKPDPEILASHLFAKCVLSHVWLLRYVCVLFRVPTEFKILVKDLCWESFSGRE